MEKSNPVEDGSLRSVMFVSAALLMLIVSSRETARARGFEARALASIDICEIEPA
jgi:hypothetical protein